MIWNLSKLRHRIIIQKQDETRNLSTGAVKVTWSNVATVWAEIAPLSAREFVTAQMEDSKVNTRITIRYRDDVTPKMRAYHASKNLYYNIEGVLSDVDSGLDYITLPCSTGVRYE